MEILFLGTGTSLGVPMIAHDAPELDLEDRRNWRTRASIHVVLGEHHVQVDAGQEFRVQCLARNLRQIDTFILTHEHADHVLGMDDLRRFCTLRDSTALDVYGSPGSLQRIREVFPYAVRETPKERFYAAFRLHEIPAVLHVQGGTIASFPLPHGSIETTGLVFTEDGTGRRCAYFTDCKSLTPEARAAAAGADVVILDALQPMEHAAHMTLAEALAEARALGARRTYFTHLTFLLDHARTAASLPPGIQPAHDGLKLVLD